MVNEKDFSSGLFLFLLGLFLAFLSIRYSIWSKFGPDEGFFPLAVAMIIIGLSLIIIVKSFFIAKPQEKGKTSDDKKRKIITTLRVSIYVILMLLYGFMLEKIGFLITSAVLIFPILKYVEKQSWKITLLVGFGSIITSYILFVHFLGVPLPRGFIGIW